MPSPLDSYLEQVAIHLVALPISRRNEELQEIRQHLLNAVTVNQELGQSEEDAAANAVVQFGTPEDLGNNLVWAWKRERSLSRRSFWGAAASTFAFLFLAALLENPFLRTCYALIGPAHPLTLSRAMLAFYFFSRLLVGTVAGSFFPKKAVTGNAFGSVVYSALCFCVYAHWIMQPGHLHQLGPISSTDIALRFLIPLILEAVIALSAAWISSRAQMAKIKRKRMVRA